MNFQEEERGYQLALELAAIVDRECPTFRGAKLSKIIERFSPARHSPDYRSVLWFGTSYSFSANQAAIVRQLWRAWENNTPKVGAGRLLSATDLLTDKISELFKRSEAWNVMIQTDGVGLYWLLPPERDPQMARHAA